MQAIILFSKPNHKFSFGKQSDEIKKFMRFLGPRPNRLPNWIKTETFADNSRTHAPEEQNGGQGHSDKYQNVDLSTNMWSLKEICS